jgi:hypothetical protein
MTARISVLDFAACVSGGSAGRSNSVIVPLLDLFGDLAVTTGTELTRPVAVAPTVDALVHELGEVLAVGEPSDTSVLTWSKGAMTSAEQFGHFGSWSSSTTSAFGATVR